MSNPDNLSDDSVIEFYEAIRKEVMADAQLGGIYRLMGAAAKERANALLTEIHRRGLNVPPITWLD